jgi:hypothetical protein
MAILAGESIETPGKQSASLQERRRAIPSDSSLEEAWPLHWPCSKVSSGQYTAGSAMVYAPTPFCYACGEPSALVSVICRDSLRARSRSCAFNGR